MIIKTSLDESNSFNEVFVLLEVLIEAIDRSASQNFLSLKVFFVCSMTVIIEARHLESSFRMRYEEESVVQRQLFDQQISPRVEVCVN